MLPIAVDESLLILAITYACKYVLKIYNFTCFCVWMWNLLEISHTKEAQGLTGPQKSIWTYKRESNRRLDKTA
jgi:hypothetical protein